jgi:thioredoxin-like negative regulator of GroEL
MNERMHTLITFLAADPGDLFSRYALAMEYRKEGQLTTCVTELQKVLQLDADYIGAYYQLGSALAQLGQTVEALTTFREGVIRAEQCGDTHSAKEMQEALAMMELELE